MRAVRSTRAVIARAPARKKLLSREPTKKKGANEKNRTNKKKGTTKRKATCGKNMLDLHRDPRGATSTPQWSRPETNVSSQTSHRHAERIALAVCCAQVLFQPRFFWCCLTRCLWKTRHPTRWLWYGLGTEHAACHAT